jgi:hypothetical protein
MMPGNGGSKHDVLHAMKTALVGLSMMWLARIALLWCSGVQLSARHLWVLNSQSRCQHAFSHNRALIPAMPCLALTSMYCTCCCSSP